MTTKIEGGLKTRTTAGWGRGRDGHDRSRHAEDGRSASAGGLRHDRRADEVASEVGGDGASSGALKYFHTSGPVV